MLQNGSVVFQLTTLSGARISRDFASVFTPISGWTHPCPSPVPRSASPADVDNLRSEPSTRRFHADKSVWFEWPSVDSCPEWAACARRRSVDSVGSNDCDVESADEPGACRYGARGELRQPE